MPLQSLTQKDRSLLSFSFPIKITFRFLSLNYQTVFVSKPLSIFPPLFTPFPKKNTFQLSVAVPKKKQSCTFSPFQEIPMHPRTEKSFTKKVLDTIHDFFLSTCSPIPFAGTKALHFWSKIMY